MASEKTLKTEKNSDFGNRLKLAIERLELNQKQFADKAGIGVSSLWEIINKGRSPTAEITKKMFDAGVNVNFLISGIGDPLLINFEQDVKIHPQPAAESGIKNARSESSGGSSATSPWIGLARRISRRFQEWERRMQHGEIDPGVRQVNDLKPEIMSDIIEILPMLNRDELMLIKNVISNRLDKDLKNSQNE